MCNKICSRSLYLDGVNKVVTKAYLTRDRSITPSTNSSQHGGGNVRINPRVHLVCQTDSLPYMESGVKDTISGGIKSRCVRWTKTWLIDIYQSALHNAVLRRDPQKQKHSVPKIYILTYAVYFPINYLRVITFWPIPAILIVLLFCFGFWGRICFAVQLFSGGVYISIVF